MTELAIQVEALPCEQLTNEECDRVASLMELTCPPTPKFLIRVDKKCDNYDYERTVQCVQRWCSNLESNRSENTISKRYIPKISEDKSNTKLNTDVNRVKGDR